MLYCNCHYRYKGQLCELLSFMPTTSNESKKVRIRLQTDNLSQELATSAKEIICPESDLEEIPLTESILQSCYKSKTYVRDGKWDILWHLGGKNNVTIGEKEDKYYLLPSESVETVTELLPHGLVQGQNISITVQPRELHSLGELEKSYPEILHSNSRLKVQL